MKRPTHSDKRRQIIDSTIKPLRKTGFEKVSVRTICQNADISIGTFYHYFRDKDDLLRAFALSFADSTVSTGSVYGSIISSTNVPLPATDEERALYRIPRGILLEGQRTGEFRADLDANLVTDSLILFLRASISRTFDTFSRCLTA